MDEQLDQRQQTLAAAEDKDDTTTMWKLITASLEEAFIRFLKLSSVQAKEMR